MCSALSNRTHYAVIACLLACLSLAGCKDKPQEDAPQAAPSNENVHLPPVPELALLDVPPTYKDGSQSIIGLLLNRDKNLQQTVTISGVMKDLYHCELTRENTGDKKSDDAYDGPVPGCKHPHFYLADSADSPKKILITGYKASWYEPQLQENARYTISGYYTLQSAQFSASETGLIIVDNIEGSGVEAPPVAEEEP